MKSSDNAELNPKYSDSLKTLSVFSFYTFLGAPIRYIQKLQLLQSCTLNIWNFFGCTLYLFCLPWFFNSCYLPRLRNVCLLHLSCARGLCSITYEIFFKFIFFFAIFWLFFFFFPLYLMDEKMVFSIKITLENFVNIALARTSILCENMICQSF